MKAPDGPGIAVIVSTYNRPDALDAVLRSLAEQTYRRFEIVVADDGSGPDTHALVARQAEDLGPRVQHVRQEDRGYRLAAIRNRAVAATEQPYLIFLDGDCLVRPDYVGRHARLAEAGRFVPGSRVRLDPDSRGSRSSRTRNRAGAPPAGSECSGRVDAVRPAAARAAGTPAPDVTATLRGVKGCNLALRRSGFLG